MRVQGAESCDVSKFTTGCRRTAMAETRDEKTKGVSDRKSPGVSGINLMIVKETERFVQRTSLSKLQTCLDPFFAVHTLTP